MNHPHQQPRALRQVHRRSGRPIVTRLEQHCAFVEVQDTEDELGKDIEPTTSPAATPAASAAEPAQASARAAIVRAAGSDRLEIASTPATEFVRAIVLGRVSTHTRGECGSKRYEPIAIDPFCVDTAPDIAGSRETADCLA